MASGVPDVQTAPFPAPSKSSAGDVKGVPTTVSIVSFSDRLLLTISQGGRLSHWVHVPLAIAASDPLNPGIFHQSNAADAENALLPRSELTATTVLGGTKREDEVFGQTLATTISSAILMKRPSEERLLVMGMGLADPTTLGRDGFEEIISLVLGCL